MKQKVAELLSEDARYSLSDISSMTGEDEDEIQKIIEELEDEDVLLGYGAVVDWSKLGKVRAYVEVDVELDRDTNYGDIAERIKSFEEVYSLRLVSGSYDFGVELMADSMEEISRFISQKIAPMEEVKKTVTHFVMDTFKDTGKEFEEREDERLSISP